VTSTRISKGKENFQKIFVIDWDGPALQKLPEDAKVESIVSVEGGARLLEHQIYRNHITGGWRLAVHIALDTESTIGKMMPDKKPPIEMRAFLKNDADILTETWSYAYKP
jgi:glucans biosynthesis protein